MDAAGDAPGTQAVLAEGGAADTPLALVSPSGWPCLPSVPIPVDPRAIPKLGEGWSLGVGGKLRPREETEAGLDPG